MKDINFCRIRCQLSVQLCVSVLLQFEELCRTSSSRNGLPLHVCLIFAVYFKEQASFCRPAEMSEFQYDAGLLLDCSKAMKAKVMCQ